MLLLHETHEVRGAVEDEFEATIREEWLPRLARSNDARLLYYLRHAHGTGPSYVVVTITALSDASAWGRLAEEVSSGDLRKTIEKLDGLRHDVRGKLLIPVPWSPLQEIDLASVPTDGREHEPTLFMEDTVHPFEGKLEDYVRASGEHYAREMEERRKSGRSILEVQAGFRTAYGSHLRREVILWQKVIRYEALVPLLTREIPEELRKPGSWMIDALTYRDRWESRLLRTASWSPYA